LAGATHEIDLATGEVYSSYSTDTEPDGHLLKACGTRRATVCEPCSARYRADAWHLIVAGLRGGKGVPEDASTHPILFVTLTAPSFGPVHSRRVGDGSARRCHPHRNERCDHGDLIRCHEVHEPEDARLGEPLCGDCFDYERAILWNAHATELWRRTTIGIQRELPKAIDMGSSRFAGHARLSYVKVVEYQDRGLVHLHVVIRLDGPSGPAEPPPAELTGDRFEAAVVDASQRVHVLYPSTPGIAGEVRWSEQIDVRRVALESTPPSAVAAYIAKYATKSTDAFGRLDHRLHESDLVSLDLRPHLQRLVTTAWDLGGRPELAHLKLRHWAHTPRVPGTLAHQESVLLDHARCPPHGASRMDGDATRFSGSAPGSDGDQGVAIPRPRVGQSGRRLAGADSRSRCRRGADAGTRGATGRERAVAVKMDKLLLTPVEAAQVLSISRSKLYELIGQGRLETVCIDTSRRVPQEALVEFVGHLQREETERET
jgi:excisionase family DNA binding protein